MTHDNLAIPVMLIIVGALRVVPQLLAGGAWGAESTLATGFLCLGLLALAAEVLRRRHGAAASGPAQASSSPGS